MAIDGSNGKLNILLQYFFSCVSVEILEFNNDEEVAV